MEGLRVIKFKHLKDNSDATSNFDVILDKPYTVGEFINEILSTRKDEWGDIWIQLKDIWSIIDPHIEYNHGEITDKFQWEDWVLEPYIKSVFANGGWSAMTYWIRLEESSNEKMETN
jgi:hypothetical protein